MEKLFVKATTKTPEIILNPEQNILSIKGNIFPEDSIEFFRPLLEKLKNYNQEKRQNPLFVSLKLEYFNSTSSASLLNIFKQLEIMFQNGQTIDIKWFYEEGDEVNLEAGEEYKSLLKTPFHLIELSEKEWNKK